MSKEPAAPAAAEGAPAGPAESKLPLLMVLVNSLVAFGGIGALYYFRVLYKRPAITETAEREHIEKTFQKKKENTTYPTIKFEPITINIESSATEPKGVVKIARRNQGKLHYATVAFSLEIVEEERKHEIERINSRIIDKVISILGRKSYNELTTVQGRYLLRTQLTDSINEMVFQAGKSLNHSYDEDPLVTNVYFSQFVVQ